MRKAPRTYHELWRVAGLPTRTIATYLTLRWLMDLCDGRVCPDDPRIYEVLSVPRAGDVRQEILDLVKSGLLDTKDGYLRLRRGRPRHG